MSLSVLLGIFLLLLSALHMGPFIVNFLSDPVLSAINAGIGVVILSTQWKNLLGFTHTGSQRSSQTAHIGCINACICSLLTWLSCILYLCVRSQRHHD